MTILNIFANQSGQIPLSELDTNFATPITIGTTTIQLGQTATTLTGVTLSGANLGTPTGNLANCVFPTLNQNTTGTAAGLSATLAVGSGGTGVTTSTGSGSVVLSNSPTLVTPALGTPASGTLTNCTFPTLNQNTTGTASNVTGTVAVLNGGTGASTLTGLAYGNGTSAFTAATGSQISSALGTTNIAGNAAGLSATLAIASGGTNSTATPAAGTVAYGTGTAIAYTSAGTVGQALISNGTGAPSWGVAGAAPIQPITASVGASALTCTLNPTTLNFRSTPLTSGTINTRTVATAISVVVPSTATLGTVSAQQSRLVLLALDNAGTVELAVVNIAGGNNLDETTLISTTAIAAGSNTANVIYSTTARTSLPFRVVGYVESTQATAGTWATAPSTVQGQGGQALAAMSSLGYGQTWQAVTRVSGTTYYNTTGKPIQIALQANTSAATFNINGLVFNFSTSTSYDMMYMIIPNGASYVYTSAGATLVCNELR